MILELHYSFLMGKVGELLAAVFALSLIGSILSGAIVYYKYILKVLFFQVPLKFRNWRTASSELHRVLGVWALLFNLVLALSGFWMVRGALNVASHFSEEEEEEAAAPAPIIPLLTTSIDGAIEQAKAQIPGIYITYIRLPRAAGDPLAFYGDTPGNWFWGKYTNTLAFDSQTGALIKLVPEEEMSMEEKLDALVHTLHFGQYGGWFIKLVYMVFSLATALISITGFLLWWKRNRPSKPTASTGRKHQKPRLLRV